MSKGWTAAEPTAGRARPDPSSVFALNLKPGGLDDRRRAVGNHRQISSGQIQLILEGPFGVYNIVHDRTKTHGLIVVDHYAHPLSNGTSPVRRRQAEFDKVKSIAVA